MKRVATRAIETARLVLEPLNPAHAALLFDALQDPRIYRWISLLPPTTMDALEARWASLTRPDDSASDNLAWAVKRHADGVYVGKCDAEVSEAGVATNVGYLIFPAFWNEGYATELLSALVADLAQQSITELHAFVTLGNQASERVLAKAGFCKVRVIRDNDTIRGSPHDDIEYVLGATRNSTD